MEDNKIFGVNKIKDDLQIYQDSKRPVKLGFQDEAFLGYIEKIASEKVLLRPSIIQEGLSDGNGKIVPFARLETEIPTTLYTLGLRYAQSLTEGYLERFIESINNRQGTIKPDN